MAQAGPKLSPYQAPAFGLLAEGSAFRRRAFVALKAIGAALFIASMVLIAMTIKDHWPAAKAAFRIGALPIAQSAGLYGMTLITSSIAWIYAMRSRGVVLPMKVGLLVNLSAQAGKYLPGNVAHFFARAGLAAREGVKLADSTIGTVVEVASTAIACTLVVAACWAIDERSLAVIDWGNRFHIPSWLLIAAAVMAVPLAVSVLMRMASILPGYLLKAMAAMVASFVLAGLSFWVIANALSGGALAPVDAVAVFAIAWIAGYLVPGAPAGFGIREGILIVWLTPLVGAGEAIACTVMHRLLSAVADGMAAICAITLAKGFTTAGARS